MWRATVRASAGIRRSDGPRDQAEVRLGKIEAEYVRGSGYSRGDTWTASSSCHVDSELILAHLVELLEVGERLLLAVELLPHHDL